MTQTFDVGETYENLKQENLKLRHELLLKEIRIKRLENALETVCNQWLKKGGSNGK